MNGFAGLLSADHQMYIGDTPTTLIVPEHSDMLNVVLHTAYGMSCDGYTPSLQCLEAALHAMRKYGLTPLQRYISPGKPLYKTILDHAPRRPIEAYALAAANNLEKLAVVASSCTLMLKLHRSIPPALAEKMGPLYMDRLYTLHGVRMDTLKQLLDRPVFPHLAKPHCSVEQRQVVNRAYRLAATQVFYEATPGQLTVFPSLLRN